MKRTIRERHLAKLPVLIIMSLVVTMVCFSQPIPADSFGMTDKQKKIQLHKYNDLSKAYRLILESNQDFYLGYPIDDSFLMWVNAKYGDDVIVDLAYNVFSGNQDNNLWYEYTGNSMHVLWLSYCKDMNYSSYQLHPIVWADCATRRELTIDFIGDVNFAENWYTMNELYANENGINDCISEDIRAELQSADITILNNEFTYGSGGTPLAGKDYTFEAKPENVSLLDSFGADMVTLANNHVFDFGEDGLVSTLQTLESYQVPYVGAGRNLAEAKMIKYIVANGKKIAIVSATEIEKFSKFTRAASTTESGVIKTQQEEVVDDIMAEAKANSDYVIAVVHWGVEGTLSYSYGQENLAKRFVNDGADVVIGGHPHRLQGVSFIESVPVAYSIGNFWFSDGSLYTTIAKVKISYEGDISLSLLPCIQQGVKTRMLTEENEVKDFYEYLADISTEVGIAEDGTFYDLSNGRPDVEMKYFSGMAYQRHSNDHDLDGFAIDIVGNRN